MAAAYNPENRRAIKFYHFPYTILNIHSSLKFFICQAVVLLFHFHKRHETHGVSVGYVMQYENEPVPLVATFSA